MRMVVDFPAPLGPSSPKHSPGGNVEADVVDRGAGAVPLDQMRADAANAAGGRGS